MPHSTLSAALTLCGEPGCRVCIALHALRRPAARRSANPRRPHHPLNTERALARADALVEVMLRHQREHGRPPRLYELGPMVGLSQHAGLLSLYMQRLEQEGRVRKVPTGEQGRGPWRWEAIA